MKIEVQSPGDEAHATLNGRLVINLKAAKALGQSTRRLLPDVEISRLAEPHRIPHLFFGFLGRRRGRRSIALNLRRPEFAPVTGAGMTG